MSRLDEFVRAMLALPTADSMRCPHCGTELSRDPFSGSRWEPGTDLICPRCDGGADVRREERLSEADGRRLAERETY
jgi:hypothetical protein